MQTQILVLDNYDSFTYNLVNLLYEAGAQQVTVKRNDETYLEEVSTFDKILISPGPGLPEEAGLTLDIIRAFYTKKSILGVCLGLQSIGVVFHSSLKNLDFPLHGVSSKVQLIQTDYLFENCPPKFQIGHYHSWVIDKLSDELELLGIDENQNIMAIRHKIYDVRGVQFHPESILTENGLQIIKNWINHQNCSL